MNVTREQVVEEIKRIAADNDVSRRVSKSFTLKLGSVIPIGKSIGLAGAMRFAKRAFRQMSGRFRMKKNSLIESYVQLLRELGRFPVARELKLKRRSDPKFPNARSFSRLGSKS